MSKFCTAAEAVAGIKDGESVASIGVIGWITPDHLLRALADRYRKDGSPKGLTFYFPCGTGDAMEIKGMDAVAIEGLMKRIISGSYINPINPKTGERPQLTRLIKENRVEAYNWPIGASMQWLREVARKSPGYLTEIGVGTFIDPDNGGGKFTERAKDELVEKILFKGKEYLFYPSWPLNHCFIRASSADEFGNLSFENEALTSAALALAIATKSCGGTVVAQVAEKVERRSRVADLVHVPGVFVDKVVLDPNQVMVTDTQFDRRYLSPANMKISDLPRLPFSENKIIGRRAYQALPKRVLTILGFGAASSMPLIMAEDGVLTDETVSDYWCTTEHGSYGGVVMSGWQFSANMWPESVIDGVTQFDVINGGLCECAALSFAEFDAEGIVNVSKFAGANPGSGGFIDIAQSARSLIFAGTFTTGGLKTAVIDGELKILKEGAHRKFVKKAGHRTYGVLNGVQHRGQSAIIVTERAVFNVTVDGLELIEIAPGIDIDRDILAHMEFMPLISPKLKKFDPYIFHDAPVASADALA